MEITEGEDYLLIKIEKKEYPTLSQGGKTLILASSGGGQKIPIYKDGQQVTLNLVAYYYPPRNQRRDRGEF